MELFTRNYKTSKTYGEKQIGIPGKVVKIVRRWIDITGNEYLDLITSLGKI